MKRQAILVSFVIIAILAPMFPLATFSGATISHGNPRLYESQSTVYWWPMFHQNPEHTGYSSSSAPNTNNILWYFTVGVSGVLYCPCPTVADGMVFTCSLTHHVYALDETTGNQIWVQTIGGRGYCAVVSDSKVFVASSDSNVYALDEATGDQLWTCKITNGAASEPAVADGKVFVGSSGGTVYALNEITGSQLWNYPTGGAVLSCPAVADNKVFVGSYDGKVYALSEATGAQVWNYPTGSFVDSSPAVTGSKVFVGSCDNNIYALNEISGKKIWSYPTGGNVQSSPAVADNKVFVGSCDNNVYALDENTGNRMWNFPTGDLVQSSPAVSDGKVFIGSCDDSFYALNEATGSEVWTYATLASIGGSSPAIADSKVFVVSSDGNLYAFGSNTPADISIDNVQPAASIIFQGTTERIDITATNKGTEAESFDFNIKEQQGSQLSENYLGSVHVFSLLPGSSKTYSFTWNTAGFSPAVYHINVYATAGNAKFLGAGPIYLQDIGYVILVGGIDKDNQYWIIDRLCNAIYMELGSIGFSKDRIYYLSRFDQYVNGEKINSATTWPNSYQQVQGAIDNWAANRVNKTEPLFLYMWGHGAKPYTSKAFLLNSLYLGGPPPYDWQDIPLPSAILASWVGSLRSQTGAEIYTICDFCNSGSFFSDLSPVSNVTICSAAQNQEAHFCNGTAWFGDPFWYTIGEGKSVSQAFNVACENVRLLCKATGLVQTPLLDDDNDGSGHTGPVPNGGDGYYASSIYIGHCEWRFPWVSSSIATQYCVWPPTGNFTLWAKVENDSSLTRVWAGMIAPDWVPANDSGFLDFGSEDFEMTDQTGDGNYTISVPAVNFTDHASGPGSFTFVILAEQADNRNAIPCLVKVEFTETGQPPSDTVPPLIHVTRPLDGSIVQGTIQVNGTTSDDVCLQKCELFVDDNLTQTIGLPQASSSYFSFPIDTSSLSNGNHTVVTESYDTSNNTANDSASVYVINDIHDLAVVSVSPDQPSTVEYYKLCVTATVANHGSYSENTEVIIYANSTPIGTASIDNLTIDGLEGVSITWNTMGFDLGNYILSAYATPVPSETNTADNFLTGASVQVFPLGGGGGGRMPYSD